MTTELLTSSPPIITMADLLERLGDIPPNRVRLRPPPGTATEADVVAIEARENRLFELVDGVLVEKPMGLPESILAGLILTMLNNFVLPRKLGKVAGADGMLKLVVGLVRIPDVAFFSRARLSGGKVPKEAVPLLVPDLAVEVLSEGNTPKEMSRKRIEYFDAGVRLLWIVDPKTRTAQVYVEADRPIETVDANGTLDGRDVVPGFTLSLSELFNLFDEQQF